MNIYQKHLKLYLHKKHNDQKEHMLDEIVDSVTKLSETQTGALITFERSQSLLDYINTGTKVNADIKSELLLTIFWEGTPLHDGATIIQGDRVVCAAAFYPQAFFGTPPRCTRTRLCPPPCP